MHACLNDGDEKKFITSSLCSFSFPVKQLALIVYS